MAKVKISATVDPGRLARAKQVTGAQSVSEVIDRGLAALVEAHLERVHAEGYEHIPQGDEAITGVHRDVWADLPWDEE